VEILRSGDTAHELKNKTLAKNTFFITFPIFRVEQSER
jgi:hypothetical protein